MTTLRKTTAIIAALSTMAYVALAWWAACRNLEVEDWEERWN